MLSNSCFRTTHSSCRSDRGRDRSRDPRSGQINLRSVNLPVGLLARAVPRDVAGLAALVASLACGAERTSVGSRAVPGDVTKLATSITLHGLCLTVASKVVRTSALVACGRAGTSTIPAPAVTTETTPADRASTTHTNARGVRASTLCKSVSNMHLGGDEAVHVEGRQYTHSQVARLPTVVAPTGTGTAQPQGWAVGLNVTQSLTVVALLGLSRPGKRALVRLVSRLLAVVAEALS